ncbi:MAG TPA: biotin--[acetyl-CoA-carboxylase] ligase [Bdellovibrionota bacterium]|nr:biotin--[acetyl-CoA-carboxylase] ligase [Bdellovibrionota bacterium]
MNWSEWLDECTSTNDVAKSLAASGAPHGTWVAARRQTEGRGRASREWKSAEGNLHLSVVVRPSHPELWTWVPLSAAVAVARVAEAVTPTLAGSLRIKWPNDLLVGGKKLGGILCEGAGSGRDGYLIVGMGVNVAYAPQVPDRPTVCLSELGSKVGLEPFAESVRWSLLQEIVELERRGPQVVMDSFWRRAWHRQGDAISWSGVDGSGEGLVQGLGPAGELLVRLPDGAEKRLLSEEVSLSRATP